MFEHFIKCADKTQYTKFIEVVEQSKEDLMKNAGYDEIAIEDFYDLFMESIKKLADVKPEDSVAHLMKLLCNHQEANYLIMYARFMAACYLKKNAILFEDFVGDVNNFCLKEVE